MMSKPLNVQAPVKSGCRYNRHDATQTSSAFQASSSEGEEKRMRFILPPVLLPVS